MKTIAEYSRVYNIKYSPEINDYLIFKSFFKN